MNDKELKASIPSMSNAQLIELLRSCGRDPYYSDFWELSIAEIKKRLGEEAK